MRIHAPEHLLEVFAHEDVTSAGHILQPGNIVQDELTPSRRNDAFAA